MTANRDQRVLERIQPSRYKWRRSVYETLASLCWVIDDKDGSVPSFVGDRLENRAIALCYRAADRRFDDERP